MKYNYVVFNTRDYKNDKLNNDGYYSICLYDLMTTDGVLVVSRPLDYAPTFIRWIFDICHSERVNSIIRMPFKKLWFPFYFRSCFKESKQICFVFLDPKITHEYYGYLKEKYPNCKLVAIHRDSIKMWKKERPYFIQNPVFDLEMTYDPNEALEYGMSHFDEFESKIDIKKTSDYPESDVFFAGKAKDRLSRLLTAYDIFEKEGLKCFFYITGVKREDQETRPGIVYSDKPMTYREMLQHSVNSRCLLEINQKGLSGYTSRFLEAVIFNKLLISDNSFIKTTKFYNPNYTQIVSDVGEINPKFVNNEEQVDYGYVDEFSPVHLINRIDKLLSSKDSEMRK